MTELFHNGESLKNKSRHKSGCRTIKNHSRITIFTSPSCGIGDLRSVVSAVQTREWKCPYVAVKWLQPLLCPTCFVWGCNVLLKNQASRPIICLGAEATFGRSLIPQEWGNENCYSWMVTNAGLQHFWKVKNMDLLLWITFLNSFLITWLLNAAVGRLFDLYVQLLSVWFADMRFLGSRIHSAPS